VPGERIGFVAKLSLPQAQTEPLGGAFKRVMT